MTNDNRPLIDLTRNNAGRLHIGVTEFDAEGYGVRSFVLVHQDEHTADSVMERRFADLVRLMGNNVRTSLTPDEAPDAANNDPIPEPTSDTKKTVDVMLSAEGAWETWTVRVPDDATDAWIEANWNEQDDKSLSDSGADSYTVTGIEDA